MSHTAILRFVPYKPTPQHTPDLGAAYSLRNRMFNCLWLKLLGWDALQLGAAAARLDLDGAAVGVWVAMLQIGLVATEPVAAAPRKKKRYRGGSRLSQAQRKRAKQRAQAAGQSAKPYAT